MGGKDDALGGAGAVIGWLTAKDDVVPCVDRKPHCACSRRTEDSAFLAPVGIPRHGRDCGVKQRLVPGFERVLSVRHQLNLHVE